MWLEKCHVKSICPFLTHVKQHKPATYLPPLHDACAFRMDKNLNPSQHLARHTVATCARLRGMNIATASKLIGVSGDTLRRWTKDYRQFLSPTAAPGSGQTRVLTRHDLSVFQFVATLRDNGVDKHDILRRLADMQNGGWETLPEVPNEWMAEPEDTVSVSLAAARASEIGQIAALQTELTHVRAQLEQATQRAEALQTRVEAIQAELDATRATGDATAASLQESLHAAQLDLERARADVARLSGRLDQYAFMGDRPLPVVVIVAVTAVAVAVLVIVLLIVVRLVV